MVFNMDINIGKTRSFWLTKLDSISALKPFRMTSIDIARKLKTCILPMHVDVILIRLSS